MVKKQSKDIKKVEEKMMEVMEDITAAMVAAVVAEVDLEDSISEDLTSVEEDSEVVDSVEDKSRSTSMTLKSK